MPNRFAWRTVGWICGSVVMLPALVAAQEPPPRLFIAVNAGQQQRPSGAQQIETPLLNGEKEHLTATYGFGSGRLIDVMGAARVIGHVWVGGGVSRVTIDGDAAVSADIPHPFFFNQLRHIEGTTSDLARRETAVHVQAQWAMPIGRHLEVRGGAGPSFVQLRQDVVADVLYAQIYPFDTATFTGVTKASRSTSTVTYNASVDAAYYFTSRIGAGAFVRVSPVTASLSSPFGDSVGLGVTPLTGFDGGFTTKSAGVEFGGGFRARF